MEINLPKNNLLKALKITAKSVAIFAILLFTYNSAIAQTYTKHYIAPAPWQYFTPANELIVTTNSVNNISITVTKSDGAFITTLTAKAGTPAVYRFSGNIYASPLYTIGTTLNAAGLIVSSTASINVNIRNVVSDEDDGGTSPFIKGNSSLFSFGDAAIGNAFRVGYYRDGNIYNNEYQTGPLKPIYSVMAIENNTVVSLNGVATVTLNAGQSYLFMANMGSLVETSGPAVMNTSATYDAPVVSTACYDGTSNPVPPISALGNEYIVVRGNGNNIAEQTTVIASEPNTSVTVYNFNAAGVLQSTNTYNLIAAGSFVTFANGIPGTPPNTNGTQGERYSSTRIVATKNVVAYSGTAEDCEVDIATLAPISPCGGSKRVETYKFRKLTTSNDLPYFSYILIKDATAPVLLTTDNGYTDKNIETIAGVGIRRQMGSSGLYIIDFTNASINNPGVITLTSTARLTVNMVQQGGGFSMSNFISPFPEKALKPTYTQANCATAVLTADPSSVGPYQWYLNGVAIDGEVNNTYTAAVSGTYTVTSQLDCGVSAQSLPITIALCNVDLQVTKTANNTSPAIGSSVIFTITAINSNVASGTVSGTGNAIGVSVTDILANGYTFVSSNAPAGTSYNNTTGKWSIGAMAPGETKVLTITATVKGPVANFNYSNTATIGGPQLDPIQGNNTSTITPVPAGITLSSASGTDSKVYCNGVVITPIEYTFSGNPLAIPEPSVSGLPNGITATYSSSAKKITIAGTINASNANNLVYTYTVSASYLNPISTITTKGTITVNSTLGTPVFAKGASSNKCQGAETLAYTATATNATSITYSLSPSSAGVINVNTGSVVWSSLFAGPTATITATASNGCGVAKTATHTVNVSSTGAITGASPVCSGSTGTLSLALASGSVVRWEASTDNGQNWSNIANTSTSYTYNNLAVTTIFRALVNTTNCTNAYSAPATITVTPRPVIADQTYTFCQTGNFTFKPLDVPNGTTYTWNAPTVSPSGNVSGTNAGTNQTAVTQSLSLSGNGLRTVTYTVTPTYAGCAGTPFKITVTMVPPLVVFSAATTTICSGSAFAITPNTNVTGTQYTWTASFLSGGAVTGFSNQTTPTDTPLGQVLSNTSGTSGTVRYLLSSIYNGCAGNTITLDVIVNSTINTNTITSTTQTICSGNTPTSIIGSTATGGNGTLIYTWEQNANGNWADAVGTNNLKDYTPGVLNQTTKYRRKVTSGSCAVSYTAPITITVNAAPTLVQSGGAASQTVCQGSPITTIVYTWGGGATGVNVTGSIANANYVIDNTNKTVTISGIFASATNYTITTTGQAASCNPAVSSGSIDITTIAAPTAVNQVFCATNNPKVSNLTPTGANIKWYASNSGGSVLASNTSLTNGNYYASQTVNGCESVTRAQITVTINAAIGTNSITANQTLCNGATPASLSGSLPTGGNENYIYTWEQSIDNGQSWTAAAGTNSNQNYQPGSLTQTTQYRRKVDAGVCSQNISTPVTITIQNIPTAGSIGASQSICAGATPQALTSATAGAGSGDITYRWDSSTNNGTNWSTVAGNSATLNLSALTITTQYRRFTISTLNNVVCESIASNVVTKTVNPLPTATITGTSTACQFGATPAITFTGANGTAPYTFKYTLNGVAKSETTTIGNNSVTVNHPTTAAGTFNYVLTSVTDASSTTCTNSASGTATVTINATPKGFNDVVTTLTCTGTLNYNLQSNVNNTTNGGNSVPSSFVWTVSSNSNVTGASDGNGTSIIQTLYNKSNVAQAVIYTVTPKATATGTCSGAPFTVTVNVPVCSSITIEKVANVPSVNKKDDVIVYTIRVKNTGNANQNGVVVNDALISAAPLTLPTGDNGNGILERGETWVYTGNYTVTQSDINNNGNPAVSQVIKNTATVKSTELPTAQNVVADVNINFAPAISIVKTGVLSTDGNSITYTFNVKNTGNTTVNNISITDNKITTPIVVSPTTLLPGASATTSATYTISLAEKSSGSVTNTATATAKDPQGGNVSDVSGTSENNNTSTVIPTGVYPLDDSGSVNALAGGEAVANVLVNDKLNGNQATTANVTIKFISSSNTNVTLNTATGKVEVAPNTPVGSHTLVYEIADISNPNNKKQATVIVDVINGSLIANNDIGSANSVTGGLAIANILINDKYNTTQTSTTATVTITEVANSNTSNGKVTLDPLTGKVTVAPNTLAGIYYIDYLITDKLDVTKTSNAKITVTVASGILVATNDANDNGAINTVAGGTAISNVLANDKYNGTNVAPTLNDVTITEVANSNTSNGKVTLDPLTGIVTVAANTAAGTYTIDYKITDKLDATKTATATITVTVASGILAATNDSGVANSITGGTAIANILANDKYNGTNVAPTLNDVTLTEVANSNTSNGKVTLDPATGIVKVAANTAAGTYTIDYKITDKLDASKTSTARIEVVVSSGVIHANVDNGIANTVTGGVAVQNVLANDNFNGLTVPTTNDVTIKEITGSNTSAGKITLDVTNGMVTVSPNTPAGTYTIDYSITDKLDASKIDTARITIIVSSGLIQANNDNATENAITGGTAIENVLANDKYNGTNTAPTLAEVTIVEIPNSNTSAGKVILNPTNGKVTVLPNTPAGTYTIEYSITDKLDASKIDTAKITVVVSSGAIQANNDNGVSNSISGGTAIANILSNDTFNAGAAATLAHVTITEIAGTNNSNNKIKLNTDGSVSVLPNTLAGTYTFDYSITDKLDPTKIDTATVSVVVSSGNVHANNDNGTVNTVTGGQAVLNILSNDTFNGGAQATSANVTISEIAASNTSAGKVTLNALTGEVVVAANTQAGTYTLDYTITDKLDASKIDTARITVIVSSGILQASADNGVANTVTGGIAIADILANDKYNGTTTAPTTANVTITEIPASNTSAGKITLNSTNGAVNVAPNTLAGTYTIDYYITDKLDATKIDTARITVVVSSHPLVANADNGIANTVTGGTAITNILTNDKYNGTNIAPLLTNVTIAEIAGSNTSAGKVTLNTTTGLVAVAAGTAAGTYTIDYSITDLLDPTQIDTARITIVVSSGAIQANNDSGFTNGFVGGTAVINVLANDTYNDGTQATLANVNLSQVSSTSTNITLDVLTGKVNVLPNTPAGTYTLVYEIVDKLDPTKVKQATVTITVTAPVLVANSNSGSVNGVPGGTAVQNVLGNDTYNGVQATLANVTISQVSSTSANVTIDPATGKVNVAPGTPEAVYTLVYQINDNLNPTLFKQATVTVTVSAAPMIANDDSGSVNGLVGGVAVTNVLGNDTYNGNEATLANVKLTQISTDNPKVNLNPVTKEVIVDAKTPAGTYTIVYQIEDQLNLGQTKQATIKVIVDAPNLVAVNDNGSVNGSTGGIAVTNVLWNDAYNNTLATTADVFISQVSSTSPKVTINANGEVIVAPNTPAGTYTLDYKITDQLNPTSTKQATVTITVTAPALVAVNDSGSANGFTGGTAVSNVLANDLYNGNQATLNDVKLSQVSTSNPNVTLDVTTGAVNVAPNTPAGNYTLVYQIEDKLNPGQTKQAAVTITVTAPAMIAVNDSRSVNGFVGGVAIPNVLANDTYNGNPATLAQVSISQISTSHPNINLDPTTGEIEVLPNTPAGTYTLVYQIEDKLNPGQTKQATVTITVTAPAIIAVNNSGAANGFTGGVAVANVLANDTYNGAVATLANVSVKQISTTNANVTIDATGKVTVAPNTPVGVYNVVYEIEDKLNPGLTKQATVMVNVTAPALVAVNDNGSVNGLTGGTAVADVLVNDTYNGTSATIANVNISQISSTDTKVSIDANGKVTVAANTPAGQYTLVYEIVDKLNPTLTKQATVTVNVTSPDLIALNDNSSINGLTGGVAITNVLWNDTYNGVDATIANVTITQVSSSNPNLKVNANGEVTVAPNTPAGIYTLVYQIEDKLNPGQKKTATVEITVIAPAMIATNDNGTTNGLIGGTAVENVLANDTYNGNPATLNDVTIYQVSTSNPKVTLDPTTGKVNVAPNTPAGTYTLVYEIKDKLNPGQTKQATIIITVTAPAMVATNDSGTSNGVTGGTAVENVLANDTYNGNPATPNDVKLAQVSTSNPNVTLDITTGKVNVAPNTPAGTYTLVYEIEDKLNPGQTKQATIIITVTAPAMVATNDSGTSNGVTGGTAVENVLSNDTYNGNPATLNDVKLAQVSTSNPNVTLDITTGKVNVTPNTPAGTYTLVYEIEDKLNPGNKKTATITITVTSGALAANPDAGTILGFAGGTIQMNILANDTYNGGNPATIANVTINQLSTENPNINIDPTNGKVIVQPRTLPGVYTLTYQITDKLDATNKATTTVVIAIPNWITDLTVTKTANKAGVEANENISYTITVTNNGTATVLAGRAIVLAETLPAGLDNVTYVSTGGVYNATANTFTTAADVNAGQSVTLVVNGKVNANYTQSDITNSVKVDAAQLATDPNPNNNTATITTPILKGKMALVKAGVMSSDGKTITYTFTIKNTGTVALSNIVLIDAKIGLNTTIAGTLAVGASTTYSQVYTLSQSDQDLGTVTNTANVNAKSPAGNIISDISGTDETNDTPTVVVAPQSSLLTFTKVVSGTIPTVVGGALNYTLVVTNTGNVTLTNIVVTDPNATITGSPITSLLPGASASLSAVHILTQADIDAGLVTNQASITAKDPKGNIVTKISDDPGTPALNDATLAEIQSQPAMVVTKVANNTGAKAGDVITYTIAIKNTGNVTLLNIVATDPNATVNGGTIAALAPGATVNVTATHVLTQGDVNAGTLSNQASVSAKDPKGNSITKISDDPNTPAPNDATIIAIGSAPSMVLTKSANNTGVKAGDVINYTLIVKNTGNVTLTNVVITDAGADVGSILPASVASILPGATAVFTAKHTLTQTDINNGQFSNQASANGKDSKNNPVSDPKSDDPNTPEPDDATVTILQPNADLVTVKRLKNPNQVSYVPGDDVLYNISVKNNGPSAASNVKVVDYAPLGTTITKWTATAKGLTLPAAYGTGNLEQTIPLFPGEAEVNYEVTVKTSNGLNRSPYAGKPLVNTVTVTSSTTDLTTAGDNKTTQALPAEIRNDLSIAKTSDKLTPTGIDTPYDYTILVKNNGFFTSNEVVVKDILPAELAYISHVTAAGSANYSKENNTVLWSIPTLQPGAVAIITIKVKAIKPGVISNTATILAKEVDPIMDNNTATDLKEIFALDTRPNVITPNGDGKNDTWVVDGLELYPENTLAIYNRWGNEVYHSTGYKNDWSGNGLKEGTYYYLLKVKDPKGVWMVTKGYITLLRNN